MWHYTRRAITSTRLWWDLWRAVTDHLYPASFQNRFKGIKFNHQPLFRSLRSQSFLMPNIVKPTQKTWLTLLQSLQQCLGNTGLNVSKGSIRYYIVRRDMIIQVPIAEHGLLMHLHSKVATTLVKIHPYFVANKECLYYTTVEIVELKWISCSSSIWCSDLLLNSRRQIQGGVQQLLS